MFVWYKSSRSWDGSRSSSTRTYYDHLFIVTLFTGINRTTYIGQIMAYEQGSDPDHDIATRTGELAMLIYSISNYSMFLYFIKR